MRAEEGSLVMLERRGATEMQLNLYGYVLKCSRDEACSSKIMGTGLVLMYGAACGKKKEIVLVVGVSSLTVVVGAGDFRSSVVRLGARERTM